MKLRLIAVLFALAALSGAAGAQDKSTKVFTLAVNNTVVLTWDASTTAGVTQYNIYRGTLSGGPYSLIGSDNALDFTDLTAGAGTWFYVVTAVGSNGVESVYSNQATAVIP